MTNTKKNSTFITLISLFIYLLCIFNWIQLYNLLNFINLLFRISVFEHTSGEA